LALQPSRPNLAVAVLAALCALAAGLKLTNAIFAVAAAVFVALAPGRTIDRAARLALFAFVGVIVSAAVAGPWMYGVWQQFDSPTFPLFNGLFGSPHFPAWSFEHYRFIPTNFTDALLTPLNLILPGRFLWTEAISPEGRFAVAFLLVVAFLVAAAFRRVTHDWRLTSLVAFFLVSWALWLATTGNGRYLMPIVILVGPIIACLVFALSRNSRWRAYSILFVLLVQAGIWSQAADTRWGGVPWSERWFSIEVPEEIKSRPIVVVSTSVQSSSFIAPMLHPRSAFVNAAGQYIIAPGKPGWERFKEIAAASGDVYALHEINELNADGLPLRPNAAMARQSVGRLGYRVLADQCKDIKLHGPRAVARSFGSTPEGGISVNAQEKPFRYYSLCKLEKDDGEIQIFLGGVNDVEPVFRALEERCPKLLQAGATNTSGGPGLWFRYYMGSDVVVQARRDRVEIARVGDSEETDIGSISDVAAGTFEFDCKPGWRMTWADKGIPTPL
jgi:MFS family permease